MNHKTLEQAAQDWALNQDGTCPACNESTLWKYKMDGFIAGAKWREVQANPVKELAITNTAIGIKRLNKDILKSQRKEIGEVLSDNKTKNLLAEKDAEIERLKAALIKIRNIDWGTDHCDEKNMIADAALGGSDEN